MNLKNQNKYKNNLVKFKKYLMNMKNKQDIRMIKIGYMYFVNRKINNLNLVLDKPKIMKK